MDECEVIGPGPATGETPSHGPCRHAETLKSKSIPSLEGRRCPWFQLMLTGWDPTPTKRAKSSDGPRIQTQNQTRSFHVAGCDRERKPTTSTGYETSQAHCGLARHVSTMVWADQFCSVQATPCLWPLVLGPGPRQGRTWCFLIPCAACHHGIRAPGKSRVSSRIFGGRQCDGAMEQRDKIRIIHFHRNRAESRFGSPPTPRLRTMGTMSEDGSIGIP